MIQFEALSLSWLLRASILFLLYSNWLLPWTTQINHYFWTWPWYSYSLQNDVGIFCKILNIKVLIKKSHGLIRWFSINYIFVMYYGLIYILCSVFCRGNSLYVFGKILFSLCKKTPNTALLSFSKQSFTFCKLFHFNNFERLVFDVFLSKTRKYPVFLLSLFKSLGCLQAIKFLIWLQRLHYE